MDEKKYVIVSDFNLRSNNRGTAALSYGAITFLVTNGYISNEYEIINYHFHRNPFLKLPNESVYEFNIDGKTWKQHILHVSAIERLSYRYHLHFFNSAFKRTITNVKLVAALNGGDGLTDIYGESLLNSRLPEIKLAMALKIPFIIMPQTIGPFIQESNKDRIFKILKKAERIYVRDNNFVGELVRNGLSYTKTKDLSFFMHPEPFATDVQKPCIGINISGLAYSNQFGNLAGNFDHYPSLITKIVTLFQNKGCKIYLIPHSYNIESPERNNDDMEATSDFYVKLQNKHNVYFIDNDLSSPKVKYLISQMGFFIGTRMHSIFAAIYTGTPVFGLAYSYKFKSAFEENKIIDRSVDINNIDSEQIEDILGMIDKAYQEDVLSNN